MPVNENFIAAVLDAAIDELIDDHIDVTPVSQFELIKSWIEDYEEFPPRNKFEIKLLDTLQAAADKLVHKHNLIPQTV